MRRLVVLTLSIALACGAGLAVRGHGTTASAADAETSDTQAAALHYLGGEVRRYQRELWRWQRLMGVPQTPTAGRVLAELSVPDAKHALALWRGRAVEARRRAQHPPHLRDWLCIHRYEATWTDGGAPYWGGLQMDLGFQRHYGAFLLRRKGTADHWTPLEQIWVAERARRSGRGFWPWPNTARYCGLL